MNHFTYNGKSTRDFGLIVNNTQIYGAPSRKVEKVSVPGRNGDILLEDGGYENYIQSYDVGITNGFRVNARNIANWLLKSKQYQTLTDTFNPDEFRLASCYNSIEYIVSSLNRYGRATIQFDCKPQRYLNANDTITLAPTSTTTTDTTMSLDTISTPLDITLQGNTTQEGTPTPTSPIEAQNVSGDNEVKVVGKNLYNITSPSGTVGGVTFTFNEDNSITAKGTVTSTSSTLATFTLKNPAQGTYFMSGGTSQVSLRCNRYNGDTLIDRRNDTGNGVSITVDSSVTELRFMLYLRTVGDVIDTVIFPQLEKGTSRTDYEPYTEQSYPINLPVENLLHVANGETTVGGVTFKETAKGIELTGSTQSSTFTILYNGTLLSGTYTLSGMDSGASTSTYQMLVYKNGSVIQYYRTATAYTFTVESTDTIALRLYVYSGQGDFGGKILPLQLEKGSVANTYTPYGTTPIELNKIGDYQDYIYKNGGKWYVHKEFNKVDLGTLTWTKTTSSTITVGYYFNAQITDFATSSTGWLCENYPNPQIVGLSNVVARLGAGVDKIGFTASSTLFYIIDSTYTDARAFKTAVNGVELVYRKGTATNTEITDTTLINQLNNIEKAYSYNGTTNILQDNSGNPFMLRVVSLRGETLTSEYNGEPIITVNEEGLISWNGNIIKVNKAPMVINSQTMQAYYGTENLNNYLEGEFPTIDGDSEVGSTMELSVVPNWWRL